MKDFVENFYNRRAWHMCRASFISERIEIDGGMCQRCHDRPGYIVHHIVELTPENWQDPEIALNHANLEFLCLQCHNQEHDVFRPAPRKVFFDDDGNVVDVIDRDLPP